MISKDKPEKIERITCQKKAISDYLKNSKDHPSAKVVYREVRKKLPRISLGTVYRILGELREKGDIQEIPGEVTRFDANTSPHTHFICQLCKRVFDVFDGVESLKFRKIKVGKVKNYQIYLYGICRECLKK